ncbi:MAG: OprO/OprP family phosphate-selective porin [Planctomycetaceae bacterium]|nr:OprO/OprP family phosphate-selective porin [Planctomycetaceae bacterium]
MLYTIANNFSFSQETNDAYYDSHSFIQNGGVETLEQTPSLMAVAYTQSPEILPPNAALEARLSALEEEFAKIQTQDTKKEDETKWTNKFSGRVYFDSVQFSDQESLPGGRTSDNYVSLSEARLSFSGKGYRNYDYSVEFFYGAAGSDNNTALGNNYRVGIRDVYVGVKNVPVLDYVRVGHFRVETGLAYMGSPKFTTAMNYPGSANYLSLNRRVGTSSSQHFADQQVRWFFAIFADQNSSFIANKAFIDDSPGIIYNTRLSMLPLYLDDGKLYLHIGGSFAYDNFSDSNMARTISLKPGVTFANASPQLVLPTGFHADHISLTGAEFAYTHRRFGVQSELQAASYGRGRTIYGAYGEIRYFLTNAYRAYDKDNGVIGSPQNIQGMKFTERSDGYCSVDSLGDWEIFAQWSYLNFNEIQRSSNQQDLTLGLNWFWNASTRMIFEYVHSMPELNGNSKSCDIFATSLRVFF